MTNAEAQHRIMSRRFFGRTGFSLAIRRDGQMIGEIGLDGTSVGALSFWLAGPHCGQGVATEAVGHFLTHMMPRLQLSSVKAEICADNRSSARTLLKLGFTAADNMHGGAMTGDGLSATREFRLTGLPVIAKRHGL